jgi:deoxyribodipyrimidine photo-lyase
VTVKTNYRPVKTEELVRTLVWFRGKDLRLDDHRPLADALAHGEVIPLFVLDPYFFAPERAQRLPHRIQFLLESLAELALNVEHKGSRLLIVRGKSVETVPRLARELRVDRVVAQRWCEPFARERDRRIAAELHVPFELFEGETLSPPGSLRTRTGEPFSVFTAFARTFAASVKIEEPLPEPQRLPPVPADVSLVSAAIPRVSELGIAPNPRLLQGGETGARARLQSFLAGPAPSYDESRDRLDLVGTSRLSVDLKFGTLSPRRLWRELRRALPRVTSARRSFENELVWREFTHSTLWDSPRVLTEPFRPAWREFPYVDDEASFQAWIRGKTGYPVVDAAARQLLAEGFVPNRARMIAASFLSKHLLIDYRRGERHYLEFLTDGDWANNNAGWQWSAGAGLDAQPYFRVFNPTLQGQKFDPGGDYVRRWVPELERLPSAHVHAPSAAPRAVLEQAGVVLGETYPRPIVEHGVARARFLAVAESTLK